MKRISDYYKVTAEKLNIEESEVQEMYEALEDWTKHNMENLLVPKIKWGHCINFVMRPHKLKEEDLQAKEMFRKWKEKDYSEYE